MRVARIFRGAAAARGPVAVLLLLGMSITTAFAAQPQGSAARAFNAYGSSYFCDRYPYLCTDPVHYSGQEYVGHDEPSLLYYSLTPGSGNSFKGIITLPKDPPTKPNQAGTAATWNFQLHPAFWFGMALCDTQSFPEFSSTCAADSDINIFNNSNPSSPDFVGHHPGTAFMELQFYPPGWVIAPNNLGCSKTKWCAALNIDSYLFNPNTNQANNVSCQNEVGNETVNFAFITKSGVPAVSPDPLTGFGNQLVVSKDVLLMKAGDTIEVRVFDNGTALEADLRDLTTGKTGSIVASASNGFAQILYQPSSPSCNEAPYSFRPMYSTSGASTRVPWAAHSYNVAFSDEIGHFEYCAVADPFSGVCLSGDDISNSDDFFCFNPSDSSKIKIGGCTFEDSDFDGPTYLFDWPGTISDPTQDQKMHAQPVKFNAAFVGSADGVAHQYDSVAFETDLPAIESNFVSGCSTADGSGCTNPPPGATFYPFFSSTTDANNGCIWQLGGANLANSTYTFESNTYSDSTEFGASPIPLVYPDTGGTATTSYNDFQNALSSNPCDAALPTLSPSLTTIAFKATKVGKKSAAKNVKLTNSLTNKDGFGIDSITAQLDDPVNFTISKNTCTKEILPKKHCTISVKATPTSATTLNTNLRIDYDGVGPEIVVPVSVTGT